MGTLHDLKYIYSHKMIMRHIDSVSGCRMERKITRGMVLQQPWARMVAEGVFPILVRPFPVKIRGRVAIVSSKEWDSLTYLEGGMMTLSEFPKLAVIGSICVSDCLGPVPIRNIRKLLTQRLGEEYSRFYPKHYLPKQPPAYFWILEKPRQLKRIKPINVGAHRVWIRFR